jgi:hypothetical protein
MVSSGPLVTAGCGKTILRRVWSVHFIRWCRSSSSSSAIIQDVLELCQEDPTCAIAYFYFDFQNHEKQTCHNLLRSLIAQFSNQVTDIPQALATRQSTRDDLDSDGLIIPLRLIIQEFHHAYVIVDALDECTERDVVLEVIQKIVDWQSKTLHILMTSRKEREIEDLLIAQCWQAVAIEESVVASDIEVHVRERLQNDVKLKKWPAKVQTEIAAKLTKGARGM